MPSSLWDLPGFDHIAFTAAAIYLHLADEQQFVSKNPSHCFARGTNLETSNTDAEWNEDGDGEGPWGYNDQDEVAAEWQTTDENQQQRLSENLEEVSDNILTEKFLDRLAQVFAFEKTLDKRKTKILGLDGIHGKDHQGSPAAHVTATGLVKRDGKMVFYVAKNKGMDDEDKVFAKSLFIWLNAPRKPSPGRNPLRKHQTDPSWPEILAFSLSRIRFYVAGILEKEKAWREERQHRESVLTTVRKDGTNRFDEIQWVFEQIDNLFRICNKHKPWLTPPTEAYEVLRLAGQIRSDHAFQRFFSYFQDTKPVVERYLSRLAMDINFLGRLEAAWNTFQVYAGKHQQNYKFIFRPIEPPKFPQIGPETLLKKIRSYPENMPKRQEALQRLDPKTKRPPNFAVHCEMQLLLHFDASKKDNKCFPYFGCSKLSCWMCTQMLDCHSVYRTRGTHGRRVGMWAFDSKSRSPRIVFALKNLQDRLTDSLIQDAFRMNLTDKTVFLNDSEERGQLIEDYRIAKSMLEKVERLLKKPDLEKCEMSTADISTSIGDNRIEQARFERTQKLTKQLPIAEWLMEQHEISKQNQPRADFWAVRSSSNMEKTERVKVKIIQRPPKFHVYLPIIWRQDNDKTSIYTPNISELSTRVKLSDWMYIHMMVAVNGTLLSTNLIFTVEDDMDLKRHHEDLAAGPAQSTYPEENLTPHGDFFIMMFTPNYDRFPDMPPVAAEIVRAEVRELIKLDQFRKALQLHKELKEENEANSAVSTNTRWTRR